jgi:hypothetical protein
MQSDFVITEQNKAEKYIQLSFELLQKTCVLASEAKDLRLQFLNSQLTTRIQKKIQECLREPNQVTFTLTKMHMQVIESVVAQCSKTEIA